MFVKDIGAGGTYLIPPFPKGSAGLRHAHLCVFLVQRLPGAYEPVTMASSTAGVEEEGLDVLVSGSTGLVGSALVPTLRDDGHRVIRLTRSGDAEDDSVRWDPLAGTIEADRLEGIDAVVHLAGENIVGRWTP